MTQGVISAPLPTPTVEPTAIPTVAPTPTHVPTPKPTATPTALPTATPKPIVTGPLAPVIVNGTAKGGMLSLTFDEGNTAAGAVAKNLDTLKAEGIRGTFFLTGTWAEANPELVKRIVAEGHEIGNHSYDHPDFTTISDAEITRQIQHTEKIIEGIVGKNPKPYFRPPYGAYDKHVQAVMAQLGYVIIYWTLDSTDWRDDSTVESEINYVLKKVQANDIIIFHGHTEKTGTALPIIIKNLKERQFTFGPLSQVVGQ
jgi:peptidoglycan/xylan/chitin deacetylase (PgdA/CDA1 family)